MIAYAFGQAVAEAYGPRTSLGEDDHEHDEGKTVRLGGVEYRLEIAEDGTPPRFRLSTESSAHSAGSAELITERPNGARQVFPMLDRGAYLESRDEIPEPHAFKVQVRVGAATSAATFEEHGRRCHDRDNSMRAAVIHVLADAAVSVLVIVGLIMARLFGWLWLGAVAGLVGAFVIASWSYGLVRDTAAILLDMLPDRALAVRMHEIIEAGGDTLADLHLWRLGPGHIGAIIAVATRSGRDASYYRERLGGLPSLSHLTVEVVGAAT